MFEAIESGALLDMPADLYAYAEWRRCRAGLDYHVEVYGHFYSVPSRLMREVQKPRSDARACSRVGASEAAAVTRTVPAMPTGGRERQRRSPDFGQEALAIQREGRIATRNLKCYM